MPACAPAHPQAQIPPLVNGKGGFRRQGAEESVSPCPALGPNLAVPTPSPADAAAAPARPWLSRPELCLLAGWDPAEGHAQFHPILRA